MEDKSKEIAIKTKCEKDYPEFTDALNGLDLETLKKNLSKYAEYREETLLAKDKDADLREAKDKAKFLAAPYNDALKAIKLKLAYLHVLIKEKS